MQLPSAQSRDSSVLGFPCSPLDRLCVLEDRSCHEEESLEVEVKVIEKRGARGRRQGKRGRQKRREGMGGEAKKEGRKGAGETD